MNGGAMDRKGQEEIALHRWAVIAEAANDRLTPAERGALVRQIAGYDLKVSAA
jgi:hypothetical protein